MFNATNNNRGGGVGGSGGMTHQQQQQYYAQHLQHQQQQQQQQQQQRQHHHQSLQQHHNNINRVNSNGGSNVPPANRQPRQQQQQQQQHLNNSQQQQQQQHHSSSHHQPQQRSASNHSQLQQQQQQRQPQQSQVQQQQQQQQRQSAQPQQQRQPNQQRIAPTTQQQQQQQQQPQQQPQQQGQQQQPIPLPAVLPKGWKKEEIVKTSGILSGLVEIVYSAPATAVGLGEPAPKKFKSKLELQRFLGDKYDMSLLDYRTGKCSQIVWRKQRRIKSIAANPNNYASACKYDSYLNLPIRQTASIFKQPVFYVTNNHKNETPPAHILSAQQTQPNNNITNNVAINNLNPNQTTNNKILPEKSKPIQLFWELRLNSLKATDSELVNESSIKQEIELETIPKFKNFEISNESAMRSVATACYLNPSKIMLGQDKDFNKNARVFIERDQPLISAITIKEEDIKQQEAKLKEMRKKLQQALKEFDELNLNYLAKIEVDDTEQQERDLELNEHLVIKNDISEDVQIKSEILTSNTNNEILVE